MEQDKQEKLIDTVVLLVYEKLSGLTDTDVCGLCQFWNSTKYHGGCQWKKKGEKVYYTTPACYLYVNEAEEK